MSRRARRSINSLTRWLLVVPAIFLVLLGCGQAGIASAKVPESADTRSRVHVDYSPWPMAVVKPLNPGVYEVIRADAGDEIALASPAAGEFWATATATPSAEPGDAATSTVTATPAAVVPIVFTATPPTTPPAMPATSATATPTHTRTSIPTSTIPPALTSTTAPGATATLTRTPTRTSTSPPPPTSTRASTATPTRTATSSGGAPAVEAASAGWSGGASLTIPHTTSGTDRLMLVGVSINNHDWETVSSVTYGGASLTRVGFVGNDNDSRVEIWSLTAPATGTSDVVIVFSSDLRQRAIAGVVTFTGVNQATPFGPLVSATGNHSSPASVAVPSAKGELVFGVAGAEYEPLTNDPGQAEHWNMSVAGEGSTNGAGSTKTGAAPATTISWTLYGDYLHWSMAGVSIKPSGAVPP